MILLIFSLIFGSTTSIDVVKNLTDVVFAPVNSPVKITRTHYTADNDEILSEYIYKDNDRVRIDTDYGDKTVTTFVYDGKTGFEQGKKITETGSLEILLFGCSYGYLSAMDKSSVSRYEEKDVILITGRQGNKLYLDYSTHLPFRYILRNKVISFSEYKTIDGFGKVPFLIIEGDTDEPTEIIRITDVEKQALIPINFFSVPKPEEKTVD